MENREEMIFEEPIEEENGRIEKIEVSVNELEELRRALQIEQQNVMTLKEIVIRLAGKITGVIQ